MDLVLLLRDCRHRRPGDLATTRGDCRTTGTIRSELWPEYPPDVLPSGAENLPPWQSSSPSHYLAALVETAMPLSLLLHRQHARRWRQRIPHSAVVMIVRSYHHHHHHHHHASYRFPDCDRFEVMVVEPMTVVVVVRMMFPLLRRLDLVLLLLRDVPCCRRPDDEQTTRGDGPTTIGTKKYYSVVVVVVVYPLLSWRSSGSLSAGMASKSTLPGPSSSSSRPA